MIAFLKKNWIIASIIPIVAFGSIISEITTLSMFLDKKKSFWVLSINLLISLINATNAFYLGNRLIILWRKEFHRISINNDIFTIYDKIDPDFQKWCNDNKIDVECYWDFSDPYIRSYIIVKNIFGYNKKLILLRLKL